jgi:hypothetical protein
MKREEGSIIEMEVLVSWVHLCSERFGGRDKVSMPSFVQGKKVATKGREGAMQTGWKTASATKRKRWRKAILLGVQR